LRAVRIELRGRYGLVNVSRQYLVILSALLAATGSCREHRDRIVVTELPAAPGIKEGSQVIFRGIEIGRVERLTLEHSGVRLALRIGRPDAPLRAGDRVALRPLGIFGEVAVHIVPGPASAPALGDSATLAAVPPDTLASARDAAVQAAAKAVAREMIAPLLELDSASPSGSRTSQSRP
jgi:ABC-type transporter Mla subunit MlaD